MRSAAPPLASSPHLDLGRWLMPLGVAACLTPVVPAALALLAGIALTLAFGNPYLAQMRRLAQPLLALSVVGLGAGMNLRAVATAGAHGIVYTMGGIALCFALGALLARKLRVPRLTGALITVGTAICGGSAIAAVVPVLKPKEHETSVALATVFALNAVALVAFPFIGHWVGLSDAQFGLWSALAIHDTSSVVGASLAWGGKAVEIATTVKLARALWIVPLTFGIGLWQKRAGGAPGKSRRPWFILGFLAAAALSTFVPALAAPGAAVAAAARRGMVVTLFLIGANLTRESLAKVGGRPLAMGLLLWVAMAGLSLTAIACRLVG